MNLFLLIRIKTIKYPVPARYFSIILKYKYLLTSFWDDITVSDEFPIHQAGCLKTAGIGFLLAVRRLKPSVPNFIRP
jgi:hypothetical protein